MKYFYELFYQADDNLLKFLNFAISQKYNWVKQNEFNTLAIPNTIFLSTPLKTFILNFKVVPVIIKLEPMMCYDWHIDETRQCSINMLIEGEDSYCFFGNRLSKELIELSELKYKKNSFYLLNTKENHSVINLNNIRYILSLGFNEDSYSKILKICQDEQL
jgi:hypothetical protein